MDLWIRSQDKKTILKTDRLDIDREFDSKEYSIKSDGFRTTIGTYKTLERALEVLDEIKKTLMNETLISALNQAYGNDNNFYQMPKE